MYISKEPPSLCHHMFIHVIVTASGAKSRHSQQRRSQMSSMSLIQFYLYSAKTITLSQGALWSPAEGKGGERERGRGKNSIFIVASGLLNTHLVFHLSPSPIQTHTLLCTISYTVHNSFITIPNHSLFLTLNLNLHKPYLLLDIINTDQNTKHYTFSIYLFTHPLS